MPLKTKRWNDPIDSDDGQRLLITRLWPRGVSRDAASWDAWMKDLAPSKALLDAFHGKQAAPISWTEYAARYVEEMREQEYRIGGLAGQLDGGDRLTLLCSSACVDPERCHRTVLARLIEERCRKPR